jgi:hypothetical protein
MPCPTADILPSCTQIVTSVFGADLPSKKRPALMQVSGDSGASAWADSRPIAAAIDATAIARICLEFIASGLD